MDQQTCIIGQDIPHHLAATAILSQAGFSTQDLSQAFKITRQAVNDRQRKLPKNMDLTSKKLVTESVRSVKAIVAGGRVGDMDKVTGTEVLKACSMVLDRHQPIKSTESQGGVSYTQINVNVYKT